VFKKRTASDLRTSAPVTVSAVPAAMPQAAVTPGPPAAVLVIDALGRKCPIPIIMLAEQIRDVPVGEIIAVRADDPAAYADIPSWCGMKSHECVYRETLVSGWEFGIRRHY
jgi:tRNA 2-thiouridine synthesizing protein A